MTREEALRRLEGTWTFELRGNQVMIRDLSLLSAVAAVRRERSLEEPPHVVARPPGTAAAPGD